MKPFILFNDESGMGAGNGGDSSEQISTEKYFISDAVKQLGYGVDIKGRKIQVIKNVYVVAPDPTTNESKRQLVKKAYVVDSKSESEEIDESKDSIDDLSDEEFKILADAGVIILDETAEKRYLETLMAMTNTKPLPPVKKK